MTPVRAHAFNLGPDRGKRESLAVGHGHFTTIELSEKHVQAGRNDFYHLGPLSLTCRKGPRLAHRSSSESGSAAAPPSPTSETGRPSSATGTKRRRRAARARCSYR